MFTFSKIILKTEAKIKSNFYYRSTTGVIGSDIRMYTRISMSRFFFPSSKNVKNCCFHVQVDLK